MAIQFFTFFRMQAPLVNQDRMAASLSASESQTVDNIRPSLKLSAHVRDINTAPLEFNGNRYQQVGTHLAEEQQVVTPLSLNPVIFERFVCVNQNPLVWDSLQGTLAALTATGSGEVVWTYPSLDRGEDIAFRHVGNLPVILGTQ